MFRQTHPTCDVAATSHLGLIYVETSRTMLRCHHDVATGTSMRRTYLRRLCDVSLADVVATYQLVPKLE